MKPEKSFIKQQLPFICYYSHKQLKSEKYMTTLGGWMNKTLIGWGVDPKSVSYTHLRAHET